MTATIKAKESIRYRELLRQYPQAKQEEIIFRLLQRYIRRLTPLETERLQGFPDNWTEGVAETQRYTQCGNAVSVTVVEAVMSCIKEIQ
ncbi:MAG: DNA cytosine methyltransferase [archaeon]|nr:DNA cytosine methyltransferase [archaeon]